MPHLLVPGIRCPVSSLEHFKTLTFGHNTVILPAEGRRLVVDFISNPEISHADTPSTENYLKAVLHVNSEKLRTIRITHFVGNFCPHCLSQWNSGKVQRVSQPDLEAM